MANTVNVTQLKDSDQLTSVHVYIGGDGSGEETDTALFDASALTGANNAGNIWNMKGCLVGFSARIEADGSTDGEALVLPDGQPFNWCFKDTNFPLTQLTGLVAATGDVTITTNGLGVGDEGFLMFTIKKSV